MSPRQDASKEDAMNKTKARFTNRIYRAEVSQTETGSPIVKVVPLNPKGSSATHYQKAAFLYELAAEIERRSEETRAQWVVSPEAWNDRLILELSTGSDVEKEQADEFVRTLLVDRNLD
jgi:hypothetical protein